MPAKWQQWYPHDINDWNGSADVQCLTDAGYRAYHNLLMAQFESEDGMLPDDDSRLATLSRMGVRWSAPRHELPTIAEEVRAKFEKGGPGRIYQVRMMEEWLRAKDLFEKRSKGGKSKDADKTDERVLQESSKSLATVFEESTPHRQGQGHRQDKKQRPTPPPATELPEWVTRESWDGFREMRKKIRAPLTARAEQQILGKLHDLRCRGHDPNACLDQSTERGWRGVFEIHGGTNGNSNSARKGPQEPCPVSPTQYDPELAAWFDNKRQARAGPDAKA